VPAAAGELRIRSGAVTLSGEQAGDGPAVVLLHGLTATRRYVVMGSRLLERSGYRVVAFDARGHGLSSPAERAAAYGYELLTDDLSAVLDALGLARAIIAGASMGAHTLVRSLDADVSGGGRELEGPGRRPARGWGGGLRARLRPRCGSRRLA
jgi:pimeloyl-ACP methyl ester carboxylesterase